MSSHRSVVALLVALSSLGAPGCAEQLSTLHAAEGRPGVAVASTRGGPASGARPATEDRAQRPMGTASLVEARTPHSTLRLVRRH